ncbi:VWA domain-containing protein [Desulfobulbus alkaliphilus]|uniref:VWA domain-containing protein n=1 Tax=Desulfobulbus alkaliphilus TaxID=869814 RepID=UPI001962BEE5|nr:VWA domain-containing protein [Desulfobulbus alkaliphilus]MBM9536613.1 hypothetical protein [Desulfobulbus alkaliphilus]
MQYLSFNKTAPLLTRRARLLLFSVLALGLTLLIAPASTTASTLQGGYGLKIFRVESGLYPFVHVYMRTFDQDMNPLVNLNVLNIGVMVQGRAYDPRKKQYFIQPIRNREEAIRSILVLDTDKKLQGVEFENLVRAAARFIDAKRPQDQIAIVALDSSSEGYTILSNFEREPAALGRRLADLQPRADKIRLYDGVAGAMQLAGGVGGGSASSTIDYPVSTSIVILATGKDDDSAINRSDLMTRIANLPLPIPIYSLGFTAGNSTGQRNLQALSTNSFGKHYPISATHDTITRSIENIQNIMQSDYVLTFRAYIPVDGGRHNVKIGVEYPTDSGIMYYDSSTFEALEPPTFPQILEAQQKLDAIMPALNNEELYLKNPFTPQPVVQPVAAGR